MKSYAIILSALFAVPFLLYPPSAARAVEGGPAPSRTAAADEESVAKRQQAIDRVRGEMSAGLDRTPARDQDEPLTDESARGAGGVLFLLFAIIVVAAAFLAYKAKRQPPPVPDADTAHREQSDSAIRATLDLAFAATEAEQVKARNPRFLELAVENRLIAESESKSLAERFQGNDFAIMLFLAERMSENKGLIGKLWGDSIEIAYTDPTKTLIQHELLAKLPKGFAEKNNVIPLYAIEGVVTVAMSTPENAKLRNRIEDQLDTLVSPVFALPDQIGAALEITRISLRALTDELSRKLASAEQEGARIGRLAEEKSIAEFVRGLFLLTMKQRASDIHIEPSETDIRIRLRVDGILQEYLNLPLKLFPSLSNVIKIMAGADIGERRRPQDGRITMKLPDRTLEFRFSCVPTIYGEKIVLRLLGENLFLAAPRLDDLDFAKSILSDIRKIIRSPNGVFFVTGPTGSGKTTTLYAVLAELNNHERNIMTIEDPVEYRMPGVNQVQVNQRAGVTFASALRSFLRQDPDVVLVGEIRDLETATIASQAALTGHLVLTTVHTNNALQAVTRVIQIGVEPFLVAPSIIGVMAQRLVRRLCEKCKEKYALSREEADRYFDWDGDGDVFFYRNKGCESCNFTGYSGRIAIHELFIIDAQTRNYIARNASILDIQKYAFSIGFTTMRYDGFKKILMGLTTVDEVDRATAASI